jgi:hypothetical protein
MTFFRDFVPCEPGDIPEIGPDFIETEWRITARKDGFTHWVLWSRKRSEPDDRDLTLLTVHAVARTRDIDGAPIPPPPRKHEP